MTYSGKLWNNNYLHYDMILPKDRKLRKKLFPLMIPVFVMYVLLCTGLLTVTIPTDIINKLKSIQWKTN